MRERDWREVVVVAAMGAASLLMLGGLLFAFSYEFPRPPGNFAVDLSRVYRLTRLRAFEPGLYALGLAAVTRFLPTGAIRRRAGQLCLLLGVLGLCSVAGQVLVIATTSAPTFLGSQPKGSGVPELLHALAALVLVGAVAWWGIEALRAPVSSHEVDAPDLA